MGLINDQSINQSKVLIVCQPLNCEIFHEIESHKSIISVFRSHDQTCA